MADQTQYPDYEAIVEYNCRPTEAKKPEPGWLNDAELRRAPTIKSDTPWGS